MNFLQAVLRTLFYVAVGGVISIVGAAFFFMNWEPDRNQYTIRGIDISHHQGDIDWAQVAADDIAFVYMKATEGGDFKDRAFARNWAGAGGAGLARGAYHFFSLCKSGREQAQNFLSVLPQDSDMLAPVVYHHSLGMEGAGVPRDEEAGLDKIQRLQGHWSRVDPFCPAARRDRLINKLGDRVEAHVYNIPHGFRSGSRLTQGSKLAWQRTLRFFDEHLEPQPV